MCKQTGEAESQSALVYKSGVKSDVLLGLSRSVMSRTFDHATNP